MRAYILQSFAFVLFVSAVGVDAQQCVSQGLGSLAKARAEIVAGNHEQGRRWIEQAALECPTSAVVLGKIADLCDVLGDTEASKSWRERAEAQQRGTPLQLQGTGSASPGSTSVCNQILQDGRGWVREKYAIVVGISQFRNASYNLRYAAKDASDFANALQDPSIGRFKADPEHVRLLVNENATVSNIRTAINDVAKDARPEDVVVMYFSSHGTAAESDAASDDAKSGYIVTHETDTSNLYGTAFAMEELRRVVEKRVRACRVVLFLDTCFSGDTAKPAAAAGSKMLAIGINDSTKERIAQGVGRVVIASSRNDEYSWESKRQPNSFFTLHLIEALRAKGGLADITTIFTHLQRTVPRAVRAELQRKQTPVMWPEGQRIDIVIGTAVD